MNKRVFLSYSWKDWPTVKRLYEDLVRSNVPVWRDQVDGDPLADFEEEFLHQIDQCDYFILCDSKNYRTRFEKKPHWCCEEVERCYQNHDKKGKPEIIVCLLDEDGEWRIDYTNGRKVFERVNRLKYQPLPQDGYDNTGRYDKTLGFICEKLEVTYKRWNKIPTYQDLMDEVRNAMKNGSAPKLDEAMVDIIKKGYEVIFDKQQMKFPNIKEAFNVWIKDCEYSGLNIMFPKWTYAVWYINQPDMDKYEALGMFQDIIHQFPHDFRGYRGFGNLAGMIGTELSNDRLNDSAYEYYSMAEKSLKKADELMDNWQRSICEFEIECNLGMLSRSTSRIDEAQIHWEKAMSIMERDGFFNEDLVSNLFMVMRTLKVPVSNTKDWLRRLLNNYPTEHILYQLTGLVYNEEYDGHEALGMLQKAYSLRPSLENLCHLLNIKIGLGLLGYNDVANIRNTLADTLQNDEDDEVWREEIQKMLDELR